MTKAGSYSIITAGKEHLDALLSIYEEFLGYYHSRYGNLLRNIALDKRTIVDYLEAQFSASESVGFLATVRSTPALVAGFALISSVSLPAETGSQWSIKDLFVTPVHRKKSLASRLIRKACEYCQSKNAHSVTLLTGKINIEAQRLYEKYGFFRDYTFQDQQNVKYELKLS